MHGYDLVTTDGDKVGHVCGQHGDYLIVEHGLLRTKHAVPQTFVELDENEQVARTTLSKQLIHESPKFHEDDHDHQAIAQHYGLAEAYDDPLTRGSGDAVADDPGRTAEEDAAKAGVDPVAERVAVRERLGSHEPDPPKYDSPGLTGGDRYRDAGVDRD